MNLYYLLNKGKFDTLENVYVVVANTKEDAKRLFEEELNKKINYCDIKWDSLNDLSEYPDEIVSGWDIFGEVRKVADIIADITKKIFSISETIDETNFIKKTFEIQNQCMLLEKATESLGVYYV